MLTLCVTYYQLQLDNGVAVVITASICRLFEFDCEMKALDCCCYIAFYDKLLARVADGNDVLKGKTHFPVIYGIGKHLGC